MSFAGFKEYVENLDTLMESDAFKKMDWGERLEAGYSLLNSKYGKGSFFGFGKVKSLKKDIEED